MNIVLLVVDTWRKKDFVKDRSIAPFLSEKADEGLYLENYYANSPWTVPAHASIFSGKIPSEHGSTTEAVYFKEENNLAEILRNEDFGIYGVSENDLVSRKTGFDKGFKQLDQTLKNLGGDIWREIWEKDSEFDHRKEKYSYFFWKVISKRDFRSLKSFFIHTYDKIVNDADFNSGKTRRTIKTALNYLELADDSFVFTNLMSVHAPYSFDEMERKQFLSQYSDEEVIEASKTIPIEDYLPNGFSKKHLEIRNKAYKASIKYTDRQLKRFYKEAPEETVFIVLGDHGELIGEYEQQGTKLIGHHLGTYKELVEVPCIIFSKGKELDLEINEKGLFSHTEISEIIEGLIKNKEVEAQETLNSEYFGRKRLVQQFGRKIPEGCEQIYNRKSFSLINSEAKYDLTTDGEYVWKTEALTEDKLLDLEKATELKNKAEVFYGWRM